MSYEILQKVCVQHDGLIEVRCPQLPEGSTAEVTVRLLSPAKLSGTLASMIGTAKRGFASAAEADAFIRRDRDAWDS